MKPSPPQAVRDEFCEEVRGEIESAKEDATDIRQRIKRLGNSHQRGLLNRIRDKSDTIKKTLDLVLPRVESAVAMYSAISSAVADPKGAIEGALNAFLAKDELSMHLVCELCGQPQSSKDEEAGPWPYSITAQNEKSKAVAAKVMPLASIALKGAAAINGISGMGRMFGYPLPKVPESCIGGLKNAVGSLEEESSVASYRLVEAQLQTGNRENSTKVEGSCLREFEKFLEENDPKHDWAGLSRVVLDDGPAMWCCEGCCKCKIPE